MHATNLYHNHLSDNRSVKSANDAFAETTVMNEIDSNATTQVLALLNDMDATVVLPSITLLQMDANQAAINDVAAAPALGVAELIIMMHEDSMVMRLLLERIATASLAGEHYPFDDYRKQLRFLLDASVSMKLDGLHQFFAHLIEATLRLETASSMNVLQACKTLDQWPVLVVDYLNHCGEVAQSKVLSQYMASSGLFFKMKAEAVAAMFDALLLPS